MRVDTLALSAHSTDQLSTLALFCGLLRKALTGMPIIVATINIAATDNSRTGLEFFFRSNRTSAAVLCGIATR
jgi:hypothetical protein